MSVCTQGWQYSTRNTEQADLEHRKVLEEMHAQEYAREAPVMQRVQAFH